MKRLKRNDDWQGDWGLFAFGMVLYVILVILQSLGFRYGLVPTGLIIPSALAPMLALLLAAVGFLRVLRNMDELQRHIQTEAFSLAFLATAIVTFSYGFLEVHAGFSRLSMFIVWPLLGVFWGLGSIIGSRRYG